MTPLEALQATLSGEHAALYLYGVLGGQVSRAGQPALAGLVNDSFLEHRVRRDRLTTLISALDATPVAAAPSYQMPNAAATPDQIRVVARLVERRCVALYGQLVGSSAGADRAWAIAALNSGAVQEVRYGAEASDFPGA
jgi:hypothetical protein